MNDIRIYRLSTLEKTEYIHEEYVNLRTQSIISGIKDILEKCKSYDIIGILCNDSFLSQGDIPLNPEMVQNLLNEYDVILPYSGSVSKRNTEDFINEISSDKSILKIVSSTVGEEYTKAVDLACKSPLLFEGGLCIAKSTHFYALFSWIIHIFESLENKGLIFDNEKTRILIAFLCKIWILNSKYKVYECNVSRTEADKYIQAKEKISLLKKYMDIHLSELVEYHKTVGFEETLADEKECIDDFEGKIPVWVCWWQGENDMPELIRACVNSIKRNIPKDKTVLRIITLENVCEYVSFSEKILEKYNDGKISYTHLSDALRAELLYRYGGMWIDATCFVSRNIPEEMFISNNLFTLAFSEPLWEMDVMEGRWTTSLWIVPPKHPLMQFVMEGLWIYWEKEDAPIDYFFLDYIIDVGYRNFDYISQSIDGSIKSTKAVYDLQLRLNQRYTYRESLRIPEESIFYKINRRYEYLKMNRLGQKTVYGYLVDGECGFDKSEDANKTIYVSLSDDRLFGKEESLLQRFLNILRETNAINVLDKDGICITLGMISRMTLNETLEKTLKIDTIYSTEVLPQVYEVIYDNILEVMPVDVSKYDIVISL